MKTFTLEVIETIFAKIDIISDTEEAAREKFYDMDGDKMDAQLYGHDGSTELGGLLDAAEQSK